MTSNPHLEQKLPSGGQVHPRYGHGIGSATYPYRIQADEESLPRFPLSNAGSRVEVILTEADALALSETLKSAFPRVVFVNQSHRGKWHEPDVWLRDSIPACGTSTVRILFPQPDWEPAAFWSASGEFGEWLIVGCPSPHMIVYWSPEIYRKQIAGDSEPWENMILSHVNISYNRYEAEHVRKKNKIVRLTRKYASRQTRGIWVPSREPFPKVDPIWAGFDAMRWCRESPRRVFDLHPNAEGRGYGVVPAD